MFAIDVDDGSRMILLKLTGFWTGETVRAFAAAIVPVIERVQRAPGSYSILSDSTEFPVQSAEVSAAFTRFMEAGAARSRGRTAIVVASVLNKLQAARVFRSPNIGVFLTRADALAWLAEVPAAAA